jgi:hypothetical protein
MSGTSESPSEVYRVAILGEAQRVLGLMDREPNSPSLGCCDRVYWAWKFVDFPGARFQEALCTLGFLWATRFEGNVYFKNDRLLTWIGHGLRYWSSIQYSDGSFDEAYPFERSLAATAFTTFYVGEAVNFLGGSLPAGIRSETLSAMRRAGNWLCENDESHGFLSNHLAAAAGALLHVYRVSGDDSYLKRSRHFVQRILDHQSSEGWYDEYGGADPGYQTHGSFYLARYWQLTEEPSILDSLGRAMVFLGQFVHVDGSLGGEYCSRNTQTYYPAAFEMLAHMDSAAAWIAEHLRPTVLTGAAADLRGIDSYNYFPLLNNTVFAFLATIARSGPTVETAEPRREEALIWMPHAGLARVRRDRYDAYVGASKGGVIKVFDRVTKEIAYSDCGYIGTLKNGDVITSQYSDSDRDVQVENNRIALSGRFVQTSRPTMTPPRFIAFRLFMISIGRIPVLARWIKRYLVKVLIYRKRSVAIEFHRTILFGDDTVSICDEISGADGRRLASLDWHEVFTTIHMGSSRYFINNELVLNTSRETETINPDMVVAGLTLQRSVRFAQVPNITV